MGVRGLQLTNVRNFLPPPTPRVVTPDLDRTLYPSPQATLFHKIRNKENPNTAETKE